VAANVGQVVPRDRKDPVTTVVQSRLMPCRRALRVVCSRNSTTHVTPDRTETDSVVIQPAFSTQAFIRYSDYL